MTKRRNRKKAPEPKVKEIQPLKKNVQKEIVDKSLVKYTTGQKRPHSASETEHSRPNKILKHITPSTPYQPDSAPVNVDALGEIFHHRSARVLEARLAAFIPNCTPAKSFSDLFNYLFLSSSNPSYESICFCYDAANAGTGFEDLCDRHDWGMEELACSGNYHSRTYVHIAIFSYILKRISCLQIVEAEKYIVKGDGKGEGQESTTDAAFLYFLKALLTAAGMVREPAPTEAAAPQSQGTRNQANQARNTRAQAATTQAAETQPTTTAESSPGTHGQLEKTPEHGAALIISDPCAIKAFKIFTQHPMVFKVQMKVGQNLLKEERCVIWCTDVGPNGEGGGGWEVQWEYMNKAMAENMGLDKANYEF